MNYHKAMTGAERVAKRRAALRAQGLRPRTFWLPDTTTPEFKEQARKDCEWLKKTMHLWEDDLRFVEAMTDDALASLPPWEGDD